MKIQYIYFRFLFTYELERTDIKIYIFCLLIVAMGSVFILDGKDIFSS